MFRNHFEMNRDKKSGLQTNQNWRLIHFNIMDVDVDIDMDMDMEMDKDTNFLVW